MGLFNKKPKPGTKPYRRMMAKQIADHHIKYVSEKKDNVDEVIGKEGSICLRDGEMLIYASQKILMRCLIDEMDAWELLSKDGVVITAKDLENGGNTRTVIVYYVYYR